MSKKSFKENPALRFINVKTEPEPSQEQIKARPAQNLSAQLPDSMAQGVPVKLNPLYVETKSKRLQLLMQPSLHQKLKEAAAGQGTSLNDLIHTVLANWVDNKL